MCERHSRSWKRIVERQSAPQVSPEEQEEVSPFLRLPAELRNDVYEHVLNETDSITFNRKQQPVPAAHPLSLTSRRIRREFAYMNRHFKVSNDLSAIRNIGISIENFNFCLLERVPIFNTVELCHSSRMHQKLEIIIYLTNTFETTLVNLRNLNSCKSLRNYDCKVNWNPRTFDVEYAKQAMTRFAASIRLSAEETQEGQYAGHFKLMKAFNKTLSRHAAYIRTTKKRRQRKG